MFSLFAIDDQRCLLVATQLNHVLLDLKMGSPIRLAGNDGIWPMADFLAIPKINIIGTSIDQVDDPKMTFESPLVFLVAFVFIG